MTKDDERAAQKAWGEISAQMYARMSPFQFYYAGWVAARAASPQAVPAQTRALTDEQIRSLKYVIARLEIASVEPECEHARNLRALLASQASGGDHG